MSYTTRQIYNYDFYVASDTTLVKDIATIKQNPVTYTKAMGFTLRNDINPNSRFRFKFDIRSTGAPGAHIAYGKIYRNGVAIGTEQTDNTSAFVSKSEDINIGGWNIGDTVDLYTKTSNVALEVWVKDFEICGTPYKWEITK